MSLMETTYSDVPDHRDLNLRETATPMAFLQHMDLAFVPAYVLLAALAVIVVLLTYRTSLRAWARSWPRSTGWPSPREWAPEWYGWFPDTHERGLKQLVDLEFVQRRAFKKKAPLAPLGFTIAHQYQRALITRPRKPMKKSAASTTA